jgi:hypothetical protein
MTIVFFIDLLTKKVVHIIAGCGQIVDEITNLRVVDRIIDNP